MSHLYNLLGYSSSQELWNSAKFSIIEGIKINEGEIGRGCYGVVYKTVYGGKECVAKEIHHNIMVEDGISPNIVESFVEMISALSTLRHPSIVPLLGVHFSASDVPLLITEKMWVNLTTWLAEKPSIPIAIKASILQDMACGLKYLHGQNPPVIHGDLTANNILLNKNLDAKLTDIRLVRALEDITNQRMSTSPESLAYMPPEAFERNIQYTPALDIFSFGCVTIHTVTQEFPKPTDQNKAANINKEEFIKISELSRRTQYIDKMSDVCENLAYLATACLRDKPEDRSDTMTIHKWLEDYWRKIGTEKHQQNAMYDLCQLDKCSLVSKLDTQFTKSNQLQSDMESCRSELKKLIDSTTSKDEEISSLQRSNNKQQVSIQSKQSEIDQLKSQLSQQSNSEIVMNLSSMLRQEQGDMKEKQDEIKNLKMKLKNLEESYANLKKEKEEKEEFHQDDTLWKPKSEVTAPTDKDLARKIQELDRERKNVKEQIMKANLLGKNYLAEFNRNIKEVQVVSESYAQREKQMHHWITTLEKQVKEISEFKQKLSDAKSTNRQQLDEKSLRLSLLQPQLNACQQKLDVKDKELSDMQSQNEQLQKLLEDAIKLHTTTQKELQNYKAACKQEVKVSKDTELLQSDLQNLIEEKEKEVASLNETLQKYQKINLEHQEKNKSLEKQIKKLTTSHSKLSRQLEAKLKDKSKYIESLEKHTSRRLSCHYRYSIHWSPYLSLPARRIKSSVAVVKDKVFVTGGYQEVSPQGRKLESYLKSLERGNEVFCFHTGKCRWDSIASPVVLGGVASVNDQCVLVSGAEGNTLTGNVYVLCEEGSDEQWKKFSEPVPTPQILPCVCCYGERWLIVCGGYVCKEGSNLLEAVNVVEILDMTKGEWCTLPEAGSPNVSTILACSIVGDDVYITGDDKVVKSDCSKLVSINTAKSDDITWTDVPILLDEEDKDLHPFSVVDVNGEPIIVASISGSEDDVTCVLMKDTTDTWRKMSEAVECQHCSAVVVTPTLELLLFGGSENVQLAGGTDICQNGTLIPIQNIWETAANIPNTVLRPPAISFTGPLHTKQFDHKGGTFQSPVHKVSIVVPPNAIDDGEKVTVHVGATTSGPFDLPEDCKLRSAVVWLGSGSDVVLKRSIAVVVPHSAVFTSPQHHSMMNFLTCEDCEGPRYKLQPSQSKFEIAPGYGLIRLQQLAIVAIASHSKSSEANESVADQKSVVVPSRYIAKLFWPLTSLPVSFRADVLCVQDIPTELYKVNTIHRKAYCKDNKAHPAVVGTKLLIVDSKNLKCVFPCDGSKECNCFTGWGVSSLIDTKENINDFKIDSAKFSFKFNCCHPGAYLSCCLELQGAIEEEETSTMPETLPKCLMSRYAKLGISPPILLQFGVNTTTKDTGSGDDAVGSHDQEKLKENI